MKILHHSFYDPVVKVMRIRSAAFTLVELLVSMSVTAVLLTALVQMLAITQKTWQQTQAQSESFRAARSVFESISRQLAQATLNNYWDYNDPNNPTFYQRQSELHYVSGPSTTLFTSTANPVCGHAVFFQAPLGMDHLSATDRGAALEATLNSWGYYVQYESEMDDRPSFLREDTVTNPERKRLRLKEFRQPTENFSLFQMPAGAPAGSRPLLHSAVTENSLYYWFRSVADERSEALADNILALIIQPMQPGEEMPENSYLYDSRAHQLAAGELSTEEAARRHQLPPMVRLTLIAVDESSWMQWNPDDIQVNALISEVNDKFSVPANYEEDLEELTSYLITEAKLQYRVFSTTVLIRAAKWHTSREL